MCPISKTDIGLWMKDIAPSTELRKWFGHDPAKWDEFKKRYLVELADKEDLINRIITKAKEGNVTLLYRVKDLEYNQAIVLMTVLSKI